MITGKLGVVTPFPTYVCTYTWPDVDQFNQELIQALDEMQAKDPEGIYRSNAAGTWHSTDKVLQECGEPGQRLGKMFYQVFSGLADCHGGQKGGRYEMRLAAWAMRYRDGGYATPHTHPNCHFSGVYYATGDGADPDKVMATGVKVRPGTLEFLDLRGGPGATQIKGLNLNPACRLKPEPGMMVVFPAWLPHFVHPIDGPDERIAIACNAIVTKYTLPTEEQQNDPDPQR